eukprot:Hpha_TRINITY_DN14312_c0_g1::TRINITY_DN14312_c0_g1_i1::g.87141::m.87141
MPRASRRSTAPSITDMSRTLAPCQSPVRDAPGWVTSSVCTPESTAWIAAGVGESEEVRGTTEGTGGAELGTCVSGVVLWCSRPSTATTAPPATATNPGLAARQPRGDRWARFEGGATGLGPDVAPDPLTPARAFKQLPRDLSSGDARLQAKCPCKQPPHS